MEEETKNNVKELQEKIIEKIDVLVGCIDFSSSAEKDDKISSAIKKMSEAYKNITIECPEGKNENSKDVQIIEDKSKKITQLEIIQTSSNGYCLRDEKRNLCAMNTHTKLIAHKLNETIEKVNCLLEKEID